MPKLSVSICSVEGCTSRVAGKGLCNLHYRRMRRHGDPLGGRPTFKGEPLEFLQSAITSQTNECIVWPFSKSSAGYGTMYLEGRYHNVHRLALERAVGRAPSSGLVAAHKPETCHNPACINPRHLRWATEAENAADRTQDGTHHLGEKTNSARLTEAEVREIRKDKRSSTQIAEARGVSRRNIDAIRSRKTWEWLDD